MSISVFNDKNVPPAESELRQALGSRYEAWERITRSMMEAYQLPGLLSYGGKNYGWNLWYKRGSRSLLSIYPQAEGLTAQVVLGKAEVAKALDLPLGAHVAKALRETPAFHDGLWLFIPIESSQDVEDILQLVMVKSRPRKSHPLQTP